MMSRPAPGAGRQPASFKEDLFLGGTGTQPPRVIQQRKLRQHLVDLRLLLCR